MLVNLPPEIIFNITKQLSCKDLSVLRLACRCLCTICDYPHHWQTIRLQPQITNSTSLWQLPELKSIIGPHISEIQSIYIWGVKDNIVQYLISNCRNLQHLTICGWTTLSDHCFRLPPSKSLKIKTLKLIGSPKQENYTSIDAYTLGRLVIQSPGIKNVILGCKAHIHAETFVAELEKTCEISLVAAQLENFFLATRRTWLEEHVLRLVRMCPDAERIALFSDVPVEFDMKINLLVFDDWMARKLKEIIPLANSTTRPFFISTGSMVLYSNT